MSVWSRIKRWFTGGGGSSSRSSSGSSSGSSSRSRSTTRASRVTNYGGGGSRSYRDYSSGNYANDYREQQQRLETRAEQQRRKREQTTNALAAISKRTDALSSGRSSSPAASATSQGDGTVRALKKLSQKANPPTRASAALKKIAEDTAERNKATNNKYNTEVGTKEERLRARQRIKSGELNADPEAARVSFEQHPIANLAGRKVAQGMSFGLSDLAERKLGGDRYAAERRLYQQAEKEHPWIAGGAEMAGALVSFGGTAGMAEKAGAKLTSKVAPKAAEKLAAKKIIQKSAARSVNKAVKKGIVKEASEELIKQVGEAKAKKIMAALGTDIVQNWTTGLVYDVATASKYHDVGSADWWKELGKSAAFNRIATGLVAGGSMLTGGKRLAAEAAEQLGKASSAKRSLRGSLKVKGKAKALRPGAEEAVENAVERNADDVARATVNNADAVRPQNVDEAVERAAVRTVEQNADEAVRAAEAPETRVVPGEEVRAGENARTGERTEFRRDNAETAREQARNKRTTNNRQQATQESFDSDFEAFERKVAENHAKAEELKRQIRAASGEEKEALQEQLKQLDREVKSAYSKASLRYHPDRGGSNEWMGKFNSVYDDYKSGKFKSRGFRSAESSTRANTGARERYRAEYSSGGNETTPPPPRGGATEAGERGFRRPQGKARRYTTTDSVEDIVYKRAERPAPREKIEDAGKTVRTQMVDSLAAFEDVERAQAKAAHAHVDHGATDRLRRHQAIANRSVGNKQIKYSGDRYSGKVTRVGADGKAYEIENGTSLKDIFKGMDEQTEREFNSYLLLRHAPDRLREGKPIFDRRYTYSIDGSKNVIDLNDPATCLREAELRLERHPEFARKAEELYQYIQNELQNRVDAGLLSQDTVSDWMHRYPNYVPTGRSGFNELHGVSGKTVGAGDIKGAKGSDLDIRNIRDQLSQATTRNWRDITTNDLFKKTFGDKIATELAKQPDGGVQMVLDNSINVGRAHEGGKYYADIFIDGRKNRVEIEKKFYDGLADLYKNGRIGVALIDTTNDAFSKVASVWKNLITEWSPIFMVKNGMRDFPEAVINSKQTKEFITSMPEAMRDLLNGGPYSTALKDSGISQSTFIDLDKAIRAGKDQKSKLARANELVEMYPRLVEYMATFKKAGVDFEHADIALRNRAAANAADVTVNFGRSGSMGKMLNKGLVPFFNPSVQGWSKFVRNVTEQPGTKERLALFAKATALGAAPLAISNFLYKDNPNYQMISARDKASNYIIPIGDGDTTNMFIKIPRSRFATAYGIPAVNLLNENKMGWAEAIKVVNDQVAPLDPLESTLFEPFLAAQRNETWYGTPIVSKGIENKTNPSQEYDANTSYIGKALGKATEKLPTKLQISPKKADYIIDAETGIAGDVILPALTPSRQAGGKNPFINAGSAMLNVPKRQFTIDSTTQNNVSSRFYDKLQAASDNNKISGATEEDSAEYKRMNAYSKEASTLTNAIRDLQGSNKEGKQEAIYGLQKVRNQLMLDALNGNDVPAKAKTVDAVQKYVGTTYAISNFGSSSDKEAMKVYGLAKYGKLSDEDMAKKIDADKDFYKGVQAIGNFEDKAAKQGVKTDTTLSKAVALASVGADEDLFGAYKATKKSRTETADKMTRAEKYLSDGGSTDEFIKLESARKSLGKLSDFDKEAELDKINDQLAKGEISEEEYYNKQSEITYNANISYVGLATSLAQSNAPARGYEVYDIKDKNIQKGINLAAMGFDARSYREMAKAVDTNGNGYPSKQEIVDYVANSDVEDKATLFDALYYYPKGKNPFGTATNYTRDEAAAAGKAKGVTQITDEKGNLILKAEESSSSGYKKGYRRRGYRRRGYRSYSGSSAKATVPKPKTIKANSFAKGEALVSSTSKSSSAKKTNKVTPPQLKRVQAKIDLPTKR